MSAAVCGSLLQGPDPSLAYRPEVKMKEAKKKEEYRNYEVSARADDDANFSGGKGAVTVINGSYLMSLKAVKMILDGDDSAVFIKVF